jgi:NADH-quinone oxidoreductase subunit H
MQPAIQYLLSFVSVPAPLAPYLAAAIAFVLALVVVLFAALYAGLFIYFERRIAGRMQSRIGPNRVGPQGILQFVADAVKLLIKEDLIPAASDAALFRLAPYLVTVGVLAAFTVLPLSPRLIGADLNIGILYVLAVTSLSVVGVLMSGWASNSKWALFGGMRAAAQIVSYEIPTGLAILPAILLAGTLSTQGIIAAQGAEPWNWFVFHSPMMFALFFVYFSSSLAEGSRTPFDLPEAESELVSGYNTEYSGFRFAAYFLSELIHTWVAAALAVIVFLGGWQIPGVPAPTVLAARGLAAFGFEVLAAAIFVAKTLCLVFVIIQLRWTLPRVRVDQLMIVCWKYLVPVAFVATFLILGWMIMIPWDSMAGQISRFVMFLSGLGLLLAYAWRVRHNIVAAHDRFYFRLRV